VSEDKEVTMDGKSLCGSLSLGGAGIDEPVMVCPAAEAGAMIEVDLAEFITLPLIAFPDLPFLSPDSPPPKI